MRAACWLLPGEVKAAAGPTAIAHTDVRYLRTTGGRTWACAVSCQLTSSNVRMDAAVCDLVKSRELVELRKPHIERR